MHGLSGDSQGGLSRACMPADSHLDWDAALLESSGAPDGFVLHTCPMTVQIPGWWIVCAYRASRLDMAAVAGRNDCEGKEVQLRQDLEIKSCGLRWNERSVSLARL